MITTLQDFISQFRKVKELGWITTHRSGPTGIGKTLEDLLGIDENNFDLPDFGETELKSFRIDTNSLLTLFTKSPLPAGVNTEIKNKFGYIDPKRPGRKIIHATLSATRFSPIRNSGVMLKIDTSVPNEIAFISNTGWRGAYYPKKRIEESISNKLDARLVYVKAEARGSDAKEQFHFVEAYALEKFNFESFTNFLERGKILVDIRIGQYPDGRTHDHGTGFRIHHEDVPFLFEKHTRLV